MKLKVIVIFISLLSVFHVDAQSKRIKKSRVNLLEKQNRPAANIPKTLLKAYSDGDIKAYYPNAPKVQVSYAQFLSHFGMAKKANKTLENGAPFWFCQKSKPISIDADVVKCMQYSFEIGEEVFRNNITYQQDTRLAYVKIIYSNECSNDGLEKEGPIFKIGDVKKLIDREYKIVNPRNSAVTYTIADYLSLKLFSAVPLKK